MTRLDTATIADVQNDFVPPPYDTPHVWRQLEEVLQRVSSIVAPVWPLADYVAVNPYQGVSERRFLDARSFLKVFSDCETLMPLGYFAKQFGKGSFDADDIAKAIDELQESGLESHLSLAEILNTLASQDASESVDSGLPPTTKAHRHIRTLSEHVDSFTEVEWTEIIRDEVSKHCAAHYDDGQSVWKSPWKDLPLFQAWRSAALHDRNVEALGLTGFRHFVSKLPQTPEAAIVHCLNWLGIPQHLWESFLLCQAFCLPGWSAWTQYKDNEEGDVEGNDFIGLLAMRLAYDAGLSDAHSLRVNWDDMPVAESESFRAPAQQDEDDVLLRYTLLRASEIAFRDRLLSSLGPKHASPAERKSAQLVFCIDVRSERMRRQLESVSPDIETFGFAGFFGMPIEHVPLGAETGCSHVPVLLKPQFQLHEGLRGGHASDEASAIDKRRQVRVWRSLWKGFQSSAVGCFSFVETTGMLYAPKLLMQTLGLGFGVKDEKNDGLDKRDAEKLGPTLRGLNHQGLTTSGQTDLAESMLRNLGLTKDFARLVVFCGHASETENNPLAAGLDCGACGGHSGEPNARLAALLLNQPYIRQALADRDIEIPEDTFFLAAVHNTATDDLQYYDTDEVPASHAADVRQLADQSMIASAKTRRERMPIVGSDSVADLFRRVSDWSEVRPEWGLAGNAAFIVAPRSVTQHANLDGRSFLHSYDHHGDPEGVVLETIMTAPMIVAHWINMQYYASSVDNRHFGSGNKTIHNVVGRFGVLSGNGGDLMTGLPWQSLHDGDDFQHHPLRLQAVIAAPRESIERVIAKHELVSNLLTNGWLHLVALDDDGTVFQYTERGDWNAIADTPSVESIPS